MNMISRLIKPQNPKLTPLYVWGAWVAFNSAAALLAVALVMIVTLLPGINPDVAAGPLLVVAFVILLGMAQGLILRQRSVGMARWMLIMSASWTATYIVSLLLNLVLPESLLAEFSASSLTFFGTVSGIIQWLYLRGSFRWAVVWVVAMTAGWTVLGLLTGPAFRSLWGFALIGLIPSIFSGAALAWLWKRGR